MASVPETMTAIEISTPGGPEVLKPKSMPTPKPGAGPDPDQGGGRRRQPSRPDAARRVSIRRRPDTRRCRASRSPARSRPSAPV